MENIEKIFEKREYAEESKETDFRVEEKESKETFAKEQILELFIDKLGSSLTLPENCMVLSKALEKNGNASQDLAKEIWNYCQELEQKRIENNNNASDTIRSLEVSLFGFVERVKKGGLTRDYKEIINEDFNALKDYISLLKHYNKFEEAELGNKDGFLVDKIEKQELTKLRENKSKYIEECKKFFKE